MNRVVPGIVLVALWTGAPYGPLLPHHPSILRYQRWFGRGIPEERPGP